MVQTYINGINSNMEEKKMTLKSSRPTDGQLISIKSHTLGSIGQIIEGKKYSSPVKMEDVNEVFEAMRQDLMEIQRIYDGYTEQMASAWVGLPTTVK